MEEEEENRSWVLRWPATLKQMPAKGHQEKRWIED